MKLQTDSNITNKWWINDEYTANDDSWWTEVYHPVLRNNIIRLIQAYGIRYTIIEGYFVGNKYIKVKVDDVLIVIDKDHWNIKQVTKLEA